MTNEETIYILTKEERTQAELLFNLANFVEFIIKGKDSKKIAAALRKDGYCRGFTIAHGVMLKQKKILWWENALKELAQWNGDPKTFFKKGFDYNNENISEQEINERIWLFTKILNFIVPPQADYRETFGEFFLDGWTQDSLFEPDSGFYFLTDEDSIAKIDTQEKIVGCLNQKQVYDLLDENRLEEAVCYTSSIDHAIHIARYNQQWILYNPNYNHNVKKEESIFHSFPDKTSLIKELFEILENKGLQLRAVLFDNQPKQQLSFFLEKTVAGLIQPNLLNGFGLDMLVRLKPQWFQQIMTQSNNDINFLSSLISGLVTQDSHGTTGFHSLLIHASQYKENILELMNKHESFLTQIVNALYEGKNLGLLFLHTKNHRKLRHKLREGLLLKNQNGNTGLHNIISAKHSPIESVINYADKHRKFRNKFLQALKTENKDTNTALDMFVLFNAKNLNYLYTIFTNHQHKKSLFRIEDALIIANDHRWPTLYLLLAFKPEQLAHLPKLKENHDEKIAFCKKALLDQKENSLQESAHLEFISLIAANLTEKTLGKSDILLNCFKILSVEQINHFLDPIIKKPQNIKYIITAFNLISNGKAGWEHLNDESVKVITQSMEIAIGRLSAPKEVNSLLKLMSPKPVLSLLFQPVNSELEQQIQSTLKNRLHTLKGERLPKESQISLQEETVTTCTNS